MKDIYSIQLLWGFLTIIFLWSTIDSILKFAVKIKYANTVYDKDISTIATSVTMLIVFSTFLFGN